MSIQAKSACRSGTAIMALALAWFAHPAEAANAERMLGGAKGSVTSDTGQALEGMMVQLVSQKNGMRTTVYTNVDGHYEFPRLDPGMYTLRIAQPREFQPWVKKDVAINGS